ncbi:MAG: ParB/RepB/Spo0J family partition protein [Candidatus Krumholzibacteriia bacterium]
MELEFDQLDLRYERLRVRSPEREKRLVASLSEVGQLAPVVVVSADEAPERLVLIDGYRRVRALRRLHHDVVRALRWDLSEVEALLLRRSLRSSSGETTLEQAWLLWEIRSRFSLSLEELASRFDRSPSWVSRRLALVGELPESVQDFIRRGQIVPHAAAKYLVPLARANEEQCERLARAIAPDRLSSREIGELYSAWRDAAPAGRERLIADPRLFLRTRSAMTEASREGLGPRCALLEDVALIAAVCRRVCRRLRGGVAGVLTPQEHKELRCALGVARAEIERLVNGLEESAGGEDARSGDEDGDPGTEEERALDSADRADAEGLAGSGPSGRRVGDSASASPRASGEGDARS